MTENQTLPAGIRPRKYLRPGTTFQFSGAAPTEGTEPADEDYIAVDLVIPPLSIYSLELLWKSEFAKLFDGKPLSMATYLAGTAEAAWLALMQNYRGVPRWLIEQTISVGNALDLIAAIRGIPGAAPTVAESAQA